MSSILVVEDEKEIADIVLGNLKAEGYQPEHVSSGEAAIEAIEQKEFCLVILDLRLEGIGGIEVCRRLRQKNKSIPVLMLTARSEEVDKVLGLEAGADDYLTKPFGIRELIARVRALLRRTGAPVKDGHSLVFGDLHVDLLKRKVTLSGAVIDLTSIEFDLLAFFASNAGRPFTREELVEKVWGYMSSGHSATINAQICRLRKKIEQDPDDPRYIKTVRGFGYQFAEPEDFA